MTLFLSESQARKRFKKKLGNSNHQIITMLVGLEAVRKKLITDPPEYLKTTWNPKDPIKSADRSRIMLFESSLVRATDSLETYIRQCRRKPSLIQETSVQIGIDHDKASVRTRFNALDEYLGHPDEKLSALVNVMISWRNKVVHSIEDDHIRSEDRSILSRNELWLKENFQGLNFGKLLTDFDKSDAPSQKEITSFIRAAHTVVELFDAQLLKKVDTGHFLREFIKCFLSKEGASAKKKAQSIWGHDDTENLRKLRTMLINSGFSTEKKYPTAATFDEALLHFYCKYRPRAILEEFDLL